MSERHAGVSRRKFIAGAAATSGAAWLAGGARRAAAQAKPTITYWNGLTGADGKVMDDLIDQFTRETGIKIEQQRFPGPISTRSSRSRCRPAKGPTWP